MLTLGDTTLAYTGAGSVQTFSENLLTLSGTFGSADPFVFTDEDGDMLVTYYGRTDKGAEKEGTFELSSADSHPDSLPFESGDVFAHWIAEFVVQPESTGKYAGASGSWTMDAYSAPFSPVEIGPTGVNIALPYRWESSGDVQLVLPTDQPEVRIDRSSFENNRASTQLGHIDGEAFSGLAGGGAILNVTGLMSIDRSTFTGNSVQGGVGIGGAGIGIPGIGDADKGGPGFGGAINSSSISPFGAAQSVLEVRRSTFVANQALGGNGGDTGPEGGEAAGGAIKISNGGVGRLDRNVFLGNTAMGGDGIDDANGGAATGGAVAGSAGATLTMNRDHFSGNSVDGGDGGEDGEGGVGRGGALGLFSVDLTGWIPDLSGSADVTRSEFTDNTANGGMGGGIYTEGELNVSSSSFTGNEARGEADVILTVSPAQISVGGSAGGAIASFNELTVTRSHFDGNLALGADGADSGDNSFFAQQAAFAGNAFGGAISSAGGSATATIEASHFRNNVAQAGDGGQGQFAAIGLGGALLSDSLMTVVGSSFRDNAAIAGNNSVSPFHNGHALGGAISSGSLLPAPPFDPTNPGASLVVERSYFADNQALGGNNNESTSSSADIPPADAPNNAYGGAILVYQGSADLSELRIVDNRAVGGTGGGELNGSLGVGGGIFLFDFLGGVQAQLDRIHLFGNEAIGGAGVAGSAGGDGLGGGLAVGSLGGLFAGPASVSVERTYLGDNVARGGAGSDGAASGDGLGGGLANVGSEPGSHTSLSHSFVRGNRAEGGDGGSQGGNGQGGGIYNGADGSLDVVRSIIFANLALAGEGETDGWGRGGGIFNHDDGDLDLDFLTEWLTRFNSASHDGDNLFGV